MKYLLADHLGSTTLSTDANGTVSASALYKAFGELRSTPSALGTDYRFTGQRDDTYINLLDYGSRRYDPELGRFIQPDSIVPTATQGTQAWDRYGYVNNNPLRYTDSTGHSIDQGDDGGDDDGNNGGSCNTETNTNAEGQPCHAYSTEPYVVCPAEYHCTEEEMKAYMLLFQYPGQTGPVQNGGNYVVAPFSWAGPVVGFITGNPVLGNAVNQMVSPMGAITTESSNSELTWTNYSKPTHVFHEGNVARTVSQNGNGDWVMTTQGSGTNRSIGVAKFNQTIGPPAFSLLNIMMRATITVNYYLGLP